MDAAITPAERNRAHARVGVAAGAAFLALLFVLFATRGPAVADPGVPATAPAPTVEPQQTLPDQGYRPRREGGFGRRGGGGPGYGGQTVPAPDSDGPGFGPGGSVPMPEDNGPGFAPDNSTPGGGDTAPAPDTGGTTT